MHLYKKCLALEQRGAASHAWIVLLRMIEALAKSLGVPFREVRARVEQEAPLGSRPDLPAMSKAAHWVYVTHTELQARRRDWIKERRAEKRAGKRIGTMQSELITLENRVTTNARNYPRVGYWGWKKRRNMAGDET